MISFKKLMFILMILFLIHTLNAERTFLYPEKREVITEKNRNKPSVPGGLESATRGELIWLFEDQNGYPCYTIISRLDTLLCWFKPPAKCSVIAYEVTALVSLDTAQKFLTMFFADLVDSIDYTSFPEVHGGSAPTQHSGFYEILDSKRYNCLWFRYCMVYFN